MKSKVTLTTIAGLVVTNVVAFQLGRRIEPSISHQPDAEFVTKYYPVEDLVTPWKGAGSTDEPEFQTLTGLITKVVATDTWGDACKLNPVPEYRLLAVTNSNNVHDEIQKLLSHVREPIAYYEECKNQNVCMHCGTSPMPKVATRCESCDRLRCEPRFAAPRFAALP